MKSKRLLAVILLLFALVACAPVSMPAPVNKPTLIVTTTSTPIPATPTPQPTSTVHPAHTSTSTPFVREKASEDCFLTIDFIPEKTGMKEVISVWGNPSSRSSYGGDLEDWYFDFVGVPHISFRKQIVRTVDFSLKNCSLGKIVSKLGPPDKIEIVVLMSCLGAPPGYLQIFHYPSLGFSYHRSCLEFQGCFTIRSNDYVFGKQFYSSDKIIQDTTGFNSFGVVYNWHGFNVNIKEIEDKLRGTEIPDTITVTPTP